MGLRGDKEREIAAAEREQATRMRHLLLLAIDPSNRDDLEVLARAHEEAARLHERLADVYDRED